MRCGEDRVASVSSEADVFRCARCSGTEPGPGGVGRGAVIGERWRQVGYVQRN
jgi:hypothetical protein